MIRLRAGSDRLVAVEKSKPIPFRALNTRRANAMRYILLDYIKEKPTHDMRGLYVILSKDKRKAMENIVADALFRKKDAYPPEERFYPLHVKPTDDTYYIPEKKIDQMAYVVNKFRKKPNESIISDVTWEESETNLQESDEIVDLKTYKICENIAKADHLVDLLEQYTFVDKEDYVPPKFKQMNESMGKPYRSIYESTTPTTTTFESSNRILGANAFFVEHCQCASKTRLVNPKSISATIIPQDEPCSCKSSISDLVDKKEEIFSTVATSQQDLPRESKVNEYQPNKRIASRGSCGTSREFEKEIPLINPSQPQDINKQNSKGCIALCVAKNNNNKVLVTPDPSQVGLSRKQTLKCFEEQALANMTQQGFNNKTSNKLTSETSKCFVPIQESEKKIVINQSKQKLTKKQTSKSRDSNKEEQNQQKQIKKQRSSSCCLPIRESQQEIPFKMTISPKQSQSQPKNTSYCDPILNEIQKTKSYLETNQDRSSKNRIIKRESLNPQNSESSFKSTVSEKNRDNIIDQSLQHRIRKRELCDQASSSESGPGSGILSKYQQQMYNVTEIKMKRIPPLSLSNAPLKMMKENFPLEKKSSETVDLLKLYSQPKIPIDEFLNTTLQRLKKHQIEQQNLENLSDIPTDVPKYRKDQHKKEILEKLPSTSVDSLKLRNISSSKRKCPKLKSLVSDKSELSGDTSSKHELKIPTDFSNSTKYNWSKPKRHIPIYRQRDKSKLCEDTSDQSQEEIVVKRQKSSIHFPRHRKRKSSRHKRPKSTSHLRDESEVRLNTSGQSKHEISKKLSTSPTVYSAHRKRTSSRHERQKSMSPVRHKSELSVNTSEQSKPEIFKKLPNIPTKLSKQKKREMSRENSQKSVSSVQDNPEFFVATSVESKQKLPNSPNDLSPHKKHTSSKQKRAKSTPHQREKTEDRYKRQKSLSPDKTQLIEDTTSQSKQKILENLPNIISDFQNFKEQKLSRHKRQKSVSPSHDKSETWINQSKRSKSDILEKPTDMPKHRKKSRHRKHQKSVSRYSDDSELILETTNQSKQNTSETLLVASKDRSNQRRHKLRHNRQKSEIIDRSSDASTDFSMEKQNKTRHKHQKSISPNNKPESCVFNESKTTKELPDVSHESSRLNDQTMFPLTDQPKINPSILSDVSSETSRLGNQTTIAYTDQTNINPFISPLRHQITQPLDSRSQKGTFELLPESRNNLSKLSRDKPSKTRKFLHKTLEKLSGTRSKGSNSKYQSQVISSTNKPETNLEAPKHSQQLVSAEPSVLSKPKYFMDDSNLSTKKSEVHINTSLNSEHYVTFESNELPNTNQHRRISIATSNKSQVLIDDDTSKQSRANIYKDLSKSKHRRHKSKVDKNHLNQSVPDSPIIDLLKSRRHRIKSNSPTVTCDLSKSSECLETSKQFQHLLPNTPGDLATPKQSQNLIFNTPSDLSKIRPNVGSSDLLESFRLHQSKLTSSTNLFKVSSRHSKLEIDKPLITNRNICQSPNRPESTMKQSKDSKYEIDKLFTEPLSKSSKRKSSRHKLPVESKERYTISGNKSVTHTSRPSTCNQDRTELLLKATKDKLIKQQSTTILNDLQGSLLNETSRKTKHRGKKQENRLQNSQVIIEPQPSEIYTMSANSITSKDQTFELMKPSTRVFTPASTMAPEISLMTTGSLKKPENTTTPVSIMSSTRVRTPVSAVTPANSVTPANIMTPASFMTPTSYMTPASNTTPVNTMTPSSFMTPTSAMTPNSSTTPVNTMISPSSMTPTSALTPSSFMTSASITPASRMTPLSYITPTSAMTSTSGMIPESSITPEDHTTSTSRITSSSCVSPSSHISSPNCFTSTSRLTSESNSTPATSMMPSIDATPEEKIYHAYNLVGIEQSTPFKSNLEKIYEDMIEVSPIKHKKSKSITGILKNKKTEPDTVENVDNIRKKEASRSHHSKSSKSVSPTSKHKHQDRHRTRSKSPKDRENRKHTNINKKDQIVDSKKRSKNPKDHVNRKDTNIIKMDQPIDHRRRSKSPKDRAKRGKSDIIKKDQTVDLNLVKQKLENKSLNSVTGDKILDLPKYSKEYLEKKISSKTKNSLQGQNENKTQIVTSQQFFMKPTEDSLSSSVDEKSTINVLDCVRKIKQHIGEDNNSKDKKNSGYEPINFSSLQQDKNNTKIITEKTKEGDTSNQFFLHKIVEAGANTKIFNSLFKRKSKESIHKQDSKSSISKASAGSSIIQLLKKHSKISKKKKN